MGTMSASLRMVRLVRLLPGHMDASLYALHFHQLRREHKHHHALQNLFARQECTYVVMQAQLFAYHVHACTNCQLYVSKWHALLIYLAEQLLLQLQGNECSRTL